MAPSPELTKDVGNQSSRNGTAVKLIVLHTTESHDRPGLGDIQAIIGWFDNPRSQASSHVVNDKEGNDARLVADERKAWTCASYNPQSLNLEQIAWARYSRTEWLTKRHAQLRNTAEWIAYWSKAHAIPLMHSTVHGVCQHRDVSGPGGHTDCGQEYPFDYVLALAREIAAQGQETPRERKWRRSLRIQVSRLARLRAGRRLLRRGSPARAWNIRASKATKERIAKLRACWRATSHAAPR